jgi:glutamyl-tRNA reductase
LIVLKIIKSGFTNLKYEKIAVIGAGTMGKRNCSHFAEVDLP